MARKVMKPFAFSNGVSVPVGATVGIHQYATHRDENYYPNPMEFNGFRFVDGNKAAGGLNEEGKGGLKNRSMYAVSRSYLAFSYGRHACPGRFFAAMELKTLFAYLIVNYDMKWPESKAERYRPADIWMGATLVPDPRGRILIRERR
ncbi:hypothetical protein FRC17_009736 [Serendipita sp. 399]|nr:hypothetical protein FRC17_009736 [Serendipita sp. 399]